MSIGAVSSASSMQQLLMAQQQQSTQQQQAANGASKDGDGDHGVEPGKGQHVNVTA